VKQVCDRVVGVLAHISGHVLGSSHGPRAGLHAELVCPSYGTAPTRFHRARRPRSWVPPRETPHRQANNYRLLLEQLEALADQLSGEDLSPSQSSKTKPCGCLRVWSCLLRQNDINKRGPVQILRMDEANMAFVA
jgi:hypothetical protein